MFKPDHQTYELLKKTESQKTKQNKKIGYRKVKKTKQKQKLEKYNIHTSCK